jgi:hypothetical protein
VYAAQLQAEAWVMLCVTAAALLTASHAGTASVRYIAVGALCGVAAYLRPDFILLPMVAGLAILLARRGTGEPFPLVLGLAAIPALVAALLLLPYALWNQANFGSLKPVPVAGALGNSLYLATWQEKLPETDIRALYRGIVTPRAEASGIGAELRALNSRIGAAPHNPPWNPAHYPTAQTQIRSSQLTLALALERIQADPAAYASRVAKNLWLLWNTSFYPAGVPGFAQLLLKASSAGVWLLGAVGVVMSVARPRSWPVPPAVALFLLYVPAVHIWLHTEARYTAAVRPLLLLFAASVLLMAIRRLSRRQPA